MIARSLVFFFFFRKFEEGAYSMLLKLIAVVHLFLMDVLIC